jgi:hypothetical protein
MRLNQAQINRQAGNPLERFRSVPFVFEYRLGGDPTLQSTRATSGDGGPVASLEVGRVSMPARG